MKTTSEIIDEVAGMYNSGNRSMKLLQMDSGFCEQCAYNGDHGRHCAFAMMCIDPSILIETKNATHNLENLGQDILKPEYRGFENSFYVAVQELHDYSNNWNSTGLSEHGKLEVNFLKRLWKFRTE